MAKQQDEPKILLDADVVIHFMKAGCQLKLTLIFPGRLVMLDKVKQELMKRKSGILGLENFLNWCKIPVEPIPPDREIQKEYANLIKTRGEGESACMAVARFRQNYIASSNLRDIRAYCQLHKITFYSTMDVLHHAILGGIMPESECDAFIAEVKLKGSKVPFNNMKEYYANLPFLPIKK